MELPRGPTNHSNPPTRTITLTDPAWTGVWVPPERGSDSAAAAGSHSPAGDHCAIHIRPGNPDCDESIPSSDDGTSAAGVPNNGSELGAAACVASAAADASVCSSVNCTGPSADHAGTGATVANRGTHFHLQCYRQHWMDCWYGRCGWISSSATDLADTQPRSMKTVRQKSDDTSACEKSEGQRFDARPAEHCCR